jgi:acylglycerol lipase
MIVKVIGFIAPTMPTIMGEGGSTSKNPYVDESYRKDPYVYNGKIIPGTIRAILNMSAKCQRLYERLNTPFLVIMGGIDKMVHPDLGEELIRRSPA